MADPARVRSSRASASALSATAQRTRPYRQTLFGAQTKSEPNNDNTVRMSRMILALQFDKRSRGIPDRAPTASSNRAAGSLVFGPVKSLTQKCVALRRLRYTMSKVRKWDGEGTFAGTRDNDGVAP